MSFPTSGGRVGAPTRRGEAQLAVMIGISALAAALVAPIGHLVALTVPPLLGFEATTTSGVMAAAAGGLFLLTWLFAPRHGLVTRLFTLTSDAPTANDGQMVSSS